MIDVNKYYETEEDMLVMTHAERSAFVTFLRMERARHIKDLEKIDESIRTILRAEARVDVMERFEW